MLEPNGQPIDSEERSFYECFRHPGVVPQTCQAPPTPACAVPFPFPVLWAITGRLKVRVQRALMASRTSCGGSGMVLAEHSMGSSSAQTPSAWTPTL